MRKLALVLPLFLAGCATEPAPAPVAIVADTYCLTAKKRSWSVNDTPETVSETLKHNSAIDRACRKA
jgi:PBP1b-binding outer membrane lipoprotein LpoB